MGGGGGGIVGPPRTTPGGAARGGGGGGAAHRCDTPNDAGWRGAEGLWLDRLAVCEAPPPGLRPTARPLDLRYGQSLWVVYAAASSAADGSAPWADWDAGADEVVFHGGRGRRPAVEDLLLFRRLGALLDGRPLGPGRPPVLEPAPDHLAIALRAEQVKAAHPDLSWEAVARALDLDVRTVHRYRAEARRAGVPSRGGSA
jgi:hypothetical protein